MSQEIDYVAVLADLETRKAALDAAIAGVRAILGQGPVEGLPLPPGVKPGGLGAGQQEVTPGVFHGLSVSQAAKKYLEMTKEKQKTAAIAKAIRKGGIETTASNFYANVFNTLKRSKDFRKLGPHWVLAEWHPHPASAVPDKASKKGKKGRKRTKPTNTKQPKATAVADTRSGTEGA
jgi:hypothetical protein